ncbi:hypothetical protein [Actinomadura sp. DC4]|uniref:hypothetical protein n=1 Tax=Actinomadura sp. DC4 TaxID=3055069 RepID=UPI0025B1CAE6|nr:hypothetical protein [Actinomadura sp. DC4]MDN3353266.1 hypothetical protein [Actinomadura sp. DC4]
MTGKGRMPGVGRTRPVLAAPPGPIEGSYGMPWSHGDRLDHIGHRRSAWSAALTERAGDDAGTDRRPAGVSSYGGRLHRTQAPEPAAAVSAFWRLGTAGDRESALGGSAPARTGPGDRARGDPARASPTRPPPAGPEAWLDATELWAAAMDR